MFIKKTKVFVIGTPLKPSLMFVREVRAYLSDAPYRSSTLGPPDLTNKL
jgi:hypothetical protein